MLKYLKLLSLCVCTTAILSACAHHKPQTSVTPAVSPVTEEPNAEAAPSAKQEDPWAQSRTYYQILLGQLAQQRGYDDVAMANLLTAAESTGDVSLAKQAFGVAVKARDMSSALRAASIWSKAEPHNLEAVAMRALAEIQLGQTDQGTESLSQILAATGNDERARLSIVQQMSRLLGQNGLELINNVAQDNPHPEWTWLALAMTARQMGDMALSLGLLNKAIDKAPEYVRAPIVKAEIQAEWDGESALDLLQQTRTMHPKDPQVAMALGRAYYQLGLFEQAIPVLAELAQQENEKEAQYLLAVSYHMAGQWSKATPLLKQSITNQMNVGAAAWLCGQAHERLKQFKEALACYRQINPEHSQIAAGAQASSRLLLKQGKVDEALRELDSLIQTVDEKHLVALWLIKLETLLNADKNEQAKAELEKLPAAIRGHASIEALALTIQVPDDGPTLLTNMRARLSAPPSSSKEWLLTFTGRLSQEHFYDEAFALVDEYLIEVPDEVDALYARSLLASQLGRPEHTEVDLRRLLSIDPNHVDALNALGYTLADMGKNLDEAQMLIERAYKARPTSAAILDSVGWLALRQSNLSKAVSFLARAWAMDNDAEIAAHYGEALWLNGNKALARTVWKEGLEQSPDHHNLKSTMQRLDK